MEVSELEALLERGETHRLILGDYEGPYALGVGRDPDNPGTNGFILKVPNTKGWPRFVTIQGHRIPVDVQGGFEPVQPLR